MLRWIWSLALAVTVAMLWGRPTQAGGLPSIVHRTFVGWLKHSCQDTGISGKLVADNSTCTYTLNLDCYNSPPSPGGFPMTGSGSCPGKFQLLLFPYPGLDARSGKFNYGSYPGWNFSMGARRSDWGATGRFEIESADPSKLNPQGHATETTGSYFVLQSYEQSTGASSAPTAIILDGITTTKPIN